MPRTLAAILELRAGDQARCHNKGHSSFFEDTQEVLRVELGVIECFAELAVFL